MLILSISHCRGAVGRASTYASHSNVLLKGCIEREQVLMRGVSVSATTLFAGLSYSRTSLGSYLKAQVPSIKTFAHVPYLIKLPRLKLMVYEASSIRWDD